MKCPNCKSEIDKENINIQADIAQCSKCNTIFKISDYIENDIDDGFDVKNPPNGAWYNLTLIKQLLAQQHVHQLHFFGSIYVNLVRRFTWRNLWLATN